MKPIGTSATAGAAASSRFLPAPLAGFDGFNLLIIFTMTPVSSDWDKPSVAKGSRPVNENGGNESNITPDSGRGSEVVLDGAFGQNCGGMHMMVPWLNQLDYLRKRGMVDAEEYGRNRREILRSKGR